MSELGMSELGIDFVGNTVYYLAVSDKADFDQDPIVGRVLGKEHKPTRGLFCIGGFIGESPLPNHIRLFTRIDFAECLDIPESAVVNREKVEKPGLPGGSYLWIKREATLGLTVVDPEHEVSTFLQGPLMKHSHTKQMRSAQIAAGFFSTPFCSVIATILVTLATFTFVACSRVDCPYTELDGGDCPDPDPVPDPESILV